MHALLNSAGVTEQDTALLQFRDASGHAWDGFLLTTCREAAAWRRSAGGQGTRPALPGPAASDAAEDVISVVRAGARGYVTKTIAAPELADAIRGARGRRQCLSSAPRRASTTTPSAGSISRRQADPELPAHPRGARCSSTSPAAAIYKEIALRLGHRRRPSRRPREPVCASRASAVRKPPRASMAVRTRRAAPRRPGLRRLGPGRLGNLRRRGSDDLIAAPAPQIEDLRAEGWSDMGSASRG